MDHVTEYVPRFNNDLYLGSLRSSNLNFRRCLYPVTLEVLRLCPYNQPCPDIGLRHPLVGENGRQFDTTRGN